MPDIQTNASFSSAEPTRELLEDALAGSARSREHWTARVAELEKVLRYLLPILEDEQRTRENSFLPEPDGEEEGWLEEIGNAVESIRAVLSQESQSTEKENLK